MIPRVFFEPMSRRSCKGLEIIRDRPGLTSRRRCKPHYYNVLELKAQHLRPSELPSRPEKNRRRSQQTEEEPAASRAAAPQLAAATSTPGGGAAGCPGADTARVQKRFQPGNTPSPPAARQPRWPAWPSPPGRPGPPGRTASDASSATKSGPAP